VYGPFAGFAPSSAFASMIAARKLHGPGSPPIAFGGVWQMPSPALLSMRSTKVSTSKQLPIGQPAIAAPEVNRPTTAEKTRFKTIGLITDPPDSKSPGGRRAHAGFS